MKPTQNIPSFRAGQSLTAESLNSVISSLLRLIVPGRGIAVRSVGNKIEISAEGQPLPRTGNSAGTIVGGWHIAESKAELPSDVASTALGRVENPEGGENGRLYYRDAANGSWICWTNLE